MSGAGAADTTLNPEDYTGFKLAIVAASWHTQVMEPTIVRVPGTFELPVAATRLAEKYDAIVALGVVIRGGTPHFDFVCQGATSGLTDVSVLTGRPVGFGVLTCDNEQQALDRAGLPGSSEDKGYEATAAALQTAATLKRLS